MMQTAHTQHVFLSLAIVTPLIYAAGMVGSQARVASVLDLFPPSGVTAARGKTDCTFEYRASGSTWVAGVNEKAVFLASIKGDGWRLGIGKGGQIYSLRGPFGESVPPQRVESPWNDEVWQFVATNEELIGPLQEYQNANPHMRTTTLPLMYFIHQAGIYTKGEGFDGGSAPAPFYSPCLRKRWNSETRTLELVNWIQQARTPCVWKSGLLVYSAYRDCGDGIIEVNQVVHNFGTETLSFLNAPWGGVRKSSLPQPLMSKPDGTWEEVDGWFGWTDIPTRPLAETGGWMAYVQDPARKNSPALALVFGAVSEAADRRGDDVIRWGTAGEKGRDYEVTERISKSRIKPGGSLAVRWYLVAGSFSDVRNAVQPLVSAAGVKPIRFDASAKQPVWIQDGTVTTDGEGSPWVELCAFPVEGTVPVFLLEDRRTGEQLITTDIYALAETEPYPNPLPEDYPQRNIYDNRVIYNQYAPHIGYENLLGFAATDATPGAGVRLELPEGISGLRLHESAQTLFVE